MVFPALAARGEAKLVEYYGFIDAIIIFAHTPPLICIKVPLLCIIYAIFKRPERATGTPGVEVDTRSIFILKCDRQIIVKRVTKCSTKTYHDTGLAKEDRPPMLAQCEMGAVINQMHL